MTEADLIARIQAHTQAKNQNIANINALDGAIQEATFWLESLKPATPIEDVFPGAELSLVPPVVK